jgi:hypothetical protein
MANKAWSALEALIEYGVGQEVRANCSARNEEPVLNAIQADRGWGRFHDCEPQEAPEDYQEDCDDYAEHYDDRSGFNKDGAKRCKEEGKICRYCEQAFQGPFLKHGWHCQAAKEILDGDGDDAEY